MTQHIDYFVEKYRLHVHNSEQRSKVVIAAIESSYTEEILIKKSKELDDKRIKKFCKMFISNPEKFSRKFKLHDRIPKEVLPCIVHMDGLGRIMYNHSISNCSDLNFFTFTFKIDENYKVSGFRTSRSYLSSKLFRIFSSLGKNCNSFRIFFFASLMYGRRLECQSSLIAFLIVS